MAPPLCGLAVISHTEVSETGSCCRFALYPYVCHAADSCRRRALWYSSAGIGHARVGLGSLCGPMRRPALIMRDPPTPTRCGPRFPGARTAPVRRTCTGCQTGREKTGTKTPMALRKAIGMDKVELRSGAQRRRRQRGLEGSPMAARRRSIGCHLFRDHCAHLVSVPLSMVASL